MNERNFSLDTSPEAFRRRIEVLRALGPAGRLTAGLALCDEVHDGLLVAARARHPGAGEGAARREVARLLLGDALYARVFPDDSR